MPSTIWFARVVTAPVPIAVELSNAVAPAPSAVLATPLAVASPTAALLTLLATEPSPTAVVGGAAVALLDRHRVRSAATVRP